MTATHHPVHDAVLASIAVPRTDDTLAVGITSDGDTTHVTIGRNGADPVELDTATAHILAEALQQAADSPIPTQHTRRYPCPSARTRAR